MRKFKYENQTWFEIVEFTLTPEQVEIVSTDIGQDLATFNPDLLIKKLEVQYFMENKRNWKVTESNSIILNSILPLLQIEVPIDDPLYNNIVLHVLERDNNKYGIAHTYKIGHDVKRKQYYIELSETLGPSISDTEILSTLTFLN